MSINENEDGYLDLLRRALEEGVEKDDRTGTGTRSLFAPQLRFDLQKGYPLMTTKQVAFTPIFAELRWFLSGKVNTTQLKSRIWDEWADEDGELGPIYGRQYRRWPTPDGKTIDQIADIEHRLATNPDDRRMIVNAWNVGELSQMRLPPCHLMYQLYSHKDPERRRHLSCHVYQRSADLFLGVPFNIASYALLTELLAVRHGMVPDTLVFSFGDAHLYNDHREQAQRQLKREPYAAPTLSYDPEDIIGLDDLGHLWPHHVGVKGYEHHAKIGAKVSV